MQLTEPNLLNFFVIAEVTKVTCKIGTPFSFILAGMLGIEKWNPIYIKKIKNKMLAHHVMRTRPNTISRNPLRNKMALVTVKRVHD